MLLWTNMISYHSLFIEYQQITERLQSISKNRLRITQKSIFYTLKLLPLNVIKEFQIRVLMKIMLPSKRPLGKNLETEWIWRLRVTILFSPIHRCRWRLMLVTTLRCLWPIEIIVAYTTRFQISFHQSKIGTFDFYFKPNTYGAKRNLSFLNYLAWQFSLLRLLYL